LIRAEVENIPLGDAEMFEELPGGVGETYRNSTLMLDRKVLDGFIEGDVSLASFEESEQLFAKVFVVVDGWHKGLDAGLLQVLL